eukprot:SAG11_NODE_2771_length_2990_cov_2.518506_3_plen_239_part_00
MRASRPPHTCAACAALLSLHAVGAAEDISAKAAAAAGVHLTYTGVPSEMAMSWVMPGNLSGAIARVSWRAQPSAPPTTVQNVSALMITDTEDMSTYNYCGGGLVMHTLFMVLLRDLPVDTVVNYTADYFVPSVGWGAAVSKQVGAAAFRTPPAQPASTLRFLATADVGDPVSHSWTALPQMARQCSELAHAEQHGQGAFELGLHIGDIAYNLDIVPRGDDYLMGVRLHTACLPRNLNS